MKNAKYMAMCTVIGTLAFVPLFGCAGKNSLATKWEYKVIQIDQNHAGNSLAFLNRAGLDGWEAFGVSGDWAYARRPLAR